MLRAVLALALLVPTLAAAAAADRVTPRTFPTPPPPAWRPEGCRAVPFTHPVLPARTVRARRAPAGAQSARSAHAARTCARYAADAATSSRGSVTVPGVAIAGRVAAARYAAGSTPASFADSSRL